VSIQFHWAVEMMEAKDVLLGAMLRDRLRVLPKIKELRLKSEEFRLTAAEPNIAQQRWW
jgi:hypothetical protein